MAENPRWSSSVAIPPHVDKMDSFDAKIEYLDEMNLEIEST